MDGVTARRRGYLEQLRRILPASPRWEEWLADSGELPPDFATMPACADLPDLLRPRGAEGERAITLPDQWLAHRDDLKALLQHWLTGTIPPAPAEMRATVLAERATPGATTRELELRFGAGWQGRLWLEIAVPQGRGPFPIFVTQHNHRGWAQIALRRGYLTCLYAGSDSRDDTDTFGPAYPDHDWSRLTRRAWAAGRCLDYLAELPQADLGRAAITGHSRNGKLALIASAFDERFGAVISSSSGVGGPMPSRYCSEQHFNEGIENITRAFPDWFHHRWRFFCGREHLMPFDLHHLLALTAPRACLLSVAYNDGVESAWAMEESYRAVQRVYRLFGAAERLRILWRPGGHETWTNTIERYLDWCDLQFGRGDAEFPERLHYPWDWSAWAAAATPPQAPARTELPDERAVWERRRAELPGRIAELLGSAPPEGSHEAGSYGVEAASYATVVGRATAPEGIRKEQLVTGEYLPVDLYRPAEGERHRVVLWLPPWNPAAGYSAVYRRGEQFYHRLARAGLAVACFDPIGTGRRIEELDGFYRRHPQWSLLGKMLRDAGAVVDTLAADERCEEIWLCGYGLGAMVALHLMALEPRCAGLAAIAPPPPLRLDTDRARTGGARRWSHQFLLLPRLGFLADQPERLPYDMDDLLAAVAPRPALLVAPRLDREAPLDLVSAGVDSARRVYRLYGAEAALRLETPEDYNRLGPELQEPLLAWARELAAGTFARAGTAQPQR